METARIVVKTPRRNPGMFKMHELTADMLIQDDARLSRRSENW